MQKVTGLGHGCCTSCFMSASSTVSCSCCALVVYVKFTNSAVVGFFSSFIVFYLTNLLFPVPGCGEMDDVDVYGTFTEAEAKKLGCAPLVIKTDSLGSASVDAEGKWDPSDKVPSLRNF